MQAARQDVLPLHSEAGYCEQRDQRDSRRLKGLAYTTLHAGSVQYPGRIRSGETRQSRAGNAMAGSGSRPKSRRGSWRSACP